MLSAIYEERFLSISYGFGQDGGRTVRPLLGYRAHCAEGEFILDADAQVLFESVSRDWLFTFLDLSVADPRIIRLGR